MFFTWFSSAFNGCGNYRHGTLPSKVFVPTKIYGLQFYGFMLLMSSSDGWELCEKIHNTLRFFSWLNLVIQLCFHRWGNFYSILVCQIKGYIFMTSNLLDSMQKLIKLMYSVMEYLLEIVSWFMFGKCICTCF